MIHDWPVSIFNTLLEALLQNTGKLITFDRNQIILLQWNPMLKFKK